MAISQLFILIFSLERQLRCKHCLISLFLLLWDGLHENQRNSGRRVNNFYREYSLAGTREISVKCPISWPTAYHVSCLKTFEHLSAPYYASFRQDMLLFSATLWVSSQQCGSPVSTDSLCLASGSFRKYESTVLCLKNGHQNARFSY